MIKQKTAPFLIVLFLLIIISSGRVLAEQRSIFVGDLINIKVTSEEFTEDELRDKFKEFEIVDIVNDEDGYRVTLRSFDTGEKTVNLGDKEIVITVKSTLDEMDRENVFEGDSSPEEAGFGLEWKYVFYVLSVIFVVSGGINLWRYLKKRKTYLLSPYESFINKIENTPLDDHQYFVKMTLYLKQYMESRFSIRVRGKTSSEIIKEISSVPDLKARLPDIRTWLLECDYCKFSGITVSKEKTQKLLRELMELVEKIEQA